MKKKRIIVGILGLILLVGLTACGDENTPTENPGTQNPPVTEPSENPGTQNPSVTEPSENPSSGSETNDDKVKLASYKTAAISKLDEIVNPVIQRIPDEDLKAAIQCFYNAEKQYVDGITDLDTAKASATKVVEDAKVFVKDTLKPLAIQKLNCIFNPLITKITN